MPSMGQVVGTIQTSERVFELVAELTCALSLQTLQVVAAALTCPRDTGGLWSRSNSRTGGFHQETDHQAAIATSVLVLGPHLSKRLSGAPESSKETAKRRFSSKSRFGLPVRVFVPKTPPMPLAVTFRPCGVLRS